MSVITVGPSGDFQTIAAAVAVAQDGDFVAVAAGTYTNDFITIRNSITLEAVGGMVTLVATEAPPNGKAIITEGATGVSVTISGFEISGAAVADNNGAAIRYEGGNLTLVNSYIHDNQEGILAGTPAVAGSGTISIDHCEFAYNGYGDGYTHNIYVNDIALLQITNSYIHDAIVGHEIKSRAENTVITGSRIIDGPTGTASYSIDLPNGGDATIMGNVIEQGPNSQNSAIISYGEEGGLHAGTAVTIDNNTILNDLTSHTPVGVVNATTTTLVVNSNTIYGFGTTPLVSGLATVTNTATLATEPAVDTSAPWSASFTQPAVACFAAGTRIILADGTARPIETLAIGMRVRIADGEVASVRWLGHRTVSCARHPRPWDVEPVRIRAGAFADGVPQRDLWLSPDHAVFVDGVLIPVRYLVNDTTLVQEARDAITYWHVELDRHAVVFAEGMPCESYLDTGNRGAFVEGGGALMLHPDLALRTWRRRGCAPLISGGRRVTAVRRRLLARLPAFGVATTADAALVCHADAMVLEAQRFGDWLCFALADDVRRFHLLSRRARPAALDPASCDRRMLGVPLAALRFDGQDIALDDPRLCAGWHAAESGLRWTDGAGTIDIAGVSIVELRLARTRLRYPVSPEAATGRAA